MNAILRLVLVAFCGLAGTRAVAQDPAKDAQNKLLAKRAAEADCYRKLAETVYGLQLNSDTTVRDFVTESDEIRTAVDAFVKGVELGQPRYYEDGACELECKVTVAKLITQLKQVHAAHYKGNVVKTTDFEQIKETVKTDLIRATGMGAPRPELPPNLPMGVEQMITPLPSGYSPPPLGVPGIWKAVGPQGRLMAERAAQVDAMRKLLERIKGLRLTSNTLVRDFITESDEIRTQVSGIVIGASVVSTYLHEDDPIAEVTMEVPVERVITKIKELHAEHYKGNTITTTDITNIKRMIETEMIRATGSGVPPSRFLAQATSMTEPLPTWFADRIEATGQGTDPAMDTAQGRLKAARAAETDARRKLAEQVFGLRIDSTTSVQDFVTRNDQISTQVSAILANSATDEAVFANDVATVRVSIPAAEVWSTVHDQMRINKRRG